MIGRICVKLNGRESGRYCVIVDKINNNAVLIDGNVRRRKCNLKHLEFTNKILDIKKGAKTEDVLEAMKKSKIMVLIKKSKIRKKNAK